MRAARRWSWLVVVLVVLVAGAAACGGGSSAPDAASSPSPSTSTSVSPPRVTMTIAEGATLTRAVPWQVRVSTSGDDVVKQVDFLIDGETKWSETESPYFFDEDQQLLAPWVLGQGSHTLTAHVTTLSGAIAEVTAHVTVRADLSANKAIAGTYHRVVTQADQDRVRAYRTEANGAFGEVPPTGRWTLRVKPNGEIVGVDPSGDVATGFVEPFTLSGSTMVLYGPAVWRQANPDTPSLFCEPEKPGSYTWMLSGTSLSISATQKVCADRDTVFVGTWTRS